MLPLLVLLWEAFFPRDLDRRWLRRAAPLAALIAAALVPAVAIGFNRKRATPLAANVAIISSQVINLVVRLLDEFWGIGLPHGIDGGAVALLVSLTLFFGISLFSPPPQLDPDVEAVMDL